MSSGYPQLLADPNHVGALQYVSIRFEDLDVLAGIAVELFRNFR